MESRKLAGDSSPEEEHKSPPPVSHPIYSPVVTCTLGAWNGMRVGRETLRHDEAASHINYWHITCCVGRRLK
jgi:hypothetical protein